MLPHADELHREAELVRNRHRDAAFCAPVQFRQRDARHADRVAEQPCLNKTVLSRRRVDDEEGLVRRPLELACDDAPNLRELVHQVRLRVQPARGVDDHDVAPFAGRGFDPLVGDGRGIGAALGADERRACALGPDLELFLGSGAERVRGRDDDRTAVTAELLGELPDRRRLPGPVDTDD